MQSGTGLLNLRGQKGWDGADSRAVHSTVTKNLAGRQVRMAQVETVEVESKHVASTDVAKTTGCARGALEDQGAAEGMAVMAAHLAIPGRRIATCGPHVWESACLATSSQPLWLCDAAIQDLS